MEDNDKIYVKAKLDNFKELLASEQIKDEVTQNHLINECVTEIFRLTGNDKFIEFMKIQNKIKKEVVNKQKKIMDIIKDKPENKLQTEINELVNKYRKNMNSIYETILKESENIDKDYDQ